MKIFKLITFFLLVSQINFWSQSIFQRFYPELEGNLIIQDIIEFDNQYWILAYEKENNENNNKFFKVKLSTSGDFISKEHLSEINLYSESYSHKYPCQFLNDGNFAVVEVKSGNSIDSFFISVYDKLNNQTFSQVLVTEDKILAGAPNFAVHTISDSVFAVLTKIGPSILRLYEKTESWGLVFEHEYRIHSNFYSSPINICSGNNDTLFISGKYQVAKLSPTGDSLWSIKTTPKIIDHLASIDNNLVICLRDNSAQVNSIKLYNSSGQEVWEKIIENYPIYPLLELEINSEDKILASNYGGYQKFSLNGDLLKTVQSTAPLYFIKKLNGVNNFFSSHSFNAVNNDLEKQVIVTNPNSSREYLTSDKVVINWLTIDVPYINIHYTSESNPAWNNIIEYLPTAENFFRWEPAYEDQDQVFIKITDFESENIFDLSDSSITLRAFEEYTLFAPNYAAMWIGNNGLGSHNPISDDSGFYWPYLGNYGKTAIYGDGLVWGGKVNGEIRVNGNTYREGLQPGKIISADSADFPFQAKYKIYKIKKDWEYLPPSIERDKYQYDYFNWPGELGAPFTDLNDDGFYTKGIDKPKFLGDETVFYVANDLDSAKTKFTYGSPPIGLEFTTLVYGFNTWDNPFLRNTIFKKYIIINKSENTIEEMYLSYWTDDDLGFAGDDFVGCDTTLSLGYTYNGDNDDEDGYGINPPAVGHMLLEISNNNRNLVKTSKNLSSFIDIDKHNGNPNDPALADYIGGTLEFYNLMQGLDNFGEAIIDPNTGDTTKYMVAGDPVEKTGWYAGDGWPDGPNAKDKRYTMTAGPFTMAPGDTQEVVYAIFMARGSSNIQSVEELKKTARALHEFWSNYIPVSVNRNNNTVPTTFSLSQNYPNPFNPTTTIKYTLPAVRHGIPSSSVISNPLAGERSQSSNKSEISPSGRNDNANVELTVYDILGRKVKTLVNKKQSPGNYEVEFNASKLASGMYFYRLNVSDKVAVKKMMLLK